MLCTVYSFNVPLALKLIFYMCTQKQEQTKLSASDFDVRVINFRMHSFVTKLTEWLIGNVFILSF